MKPNTRNRHKIIDLESDRLKNFYNESSDFNGFLDLRVQNITNIYIYIKRN